MKRISFGISFVMLLAIIHRAPCDEPLVSRIYPVADLVQPGGAGNNRFLDDRLLSAIIHMTGAKTWETHGGRGMAHFYPLGMAIGVSQTASVHREIETLFKSMRASRIPWHQLQ
jgi:hypothetical protein